MKGYKAMISKGFRVTFFSLIIGTMLTSFFIANLNNHSTPVVNIANASTEINRSFAPTPGNKPAPTLGELEPIVQGSIEPKNIPVLVKSKSTNNETAQSKVDNITKIPVAIDHLPINAQKKKLIKFGWDDKNVDYIRNNIRSMEAAHPYLDGIVIDYGKDKRPRHFFDYPLWTEQDLMIEELGEIDFHTFKHNFLNVSLSSLTTDPDWFNEALWNNVLANTRLASKALNVCQGCAGIILDTEYYKDHVYSYSPWVYRNDIYSQSFDEVKVKVYQRGQQFMQALRNQRNTFDILILHSFVDMWKRMQKNKDLLRDNTYALLPAFIDGMLDQAGDCKIVDGAENLSYYIDETLEYPNTYLLAIEAAKNLLAPKSFAKMHQNLQIAMAMYPAHYVSNYRVQNNFSEQEITKWLAHNVYNSLLHTDEYAWIFTSRGTGSFKRENWWSDPVENLPDFMIQGYVEGKNKFENTQSLGYDMVSELQNGRWSKVGVGYDGSTMRLYINDKEAGSSLDGLQSGSLRDRNIGYVGYSNSSFPYFKGAIDEVKFFGSAVADNSELLAHWNFDTVVDDKFIYDSTSSNLEGILKGNVNLVPEQSGSVLYFDGSNSGVSLPELYQGTKNSFYAEAWIKPDAIESTTQTILGTGGMNLGVEFHHLCAYTFTDKFVRICGAGARSMPPSDLILEPIQNVANGFEVKGDLLNQDGHVEIYVNSQPIYSIENKDFKFKLELDQGDYIIYARYFSKDGLHYPSNYLIHSAQ